MQLWTDYEGATIDGAFPLKKLLMPEGRSAFFSTAGTDGEPTVVRLIECHFDEEDILSRWRCIEALNHPNFLKFERFGQTELDGRPVVYAVFEKVDGNLAEVLDQGSLPVEDVAQLASSLVAALEVLHTHGFIHEHVEPRNIFAIGNVVKLRGDCVREAPEGEEGRAAKRRDVHDLATVLLQGLTQRTSIDGVTAAALPAPFGPIIRNGLDGTWGLDDIRAALGRQFGSNQAPAAAVNAATATTPVVEQNVAKAAAKPPVPAEAQLPLPLRTREQTVGLAGAPTRNDNGIREDGWKDVLGDSLRSSWLGAGVVALVLILSTWFVVHAWTAHRHNAPQEAAVSQPAAPSAGQISSSPTRAPLAANSPRVSLPAAAASHAGWRVIAFTYNRRTDAEKKASDLAHSHPELQPAVFTPSGHAPYLVSIGGVMDRDTAYALAHRSRSLGLPHDIYAQNYSH
jgi:eukaryotic-like serine/threonine-protein kinase